MDIINPLNITSAALITQFFLLLIMFVAAIIARWSDVFYIPYLKKNIPRLPWVILAAALVTIGSLVFSEDFAPTWKPLFGGTLPVSTIKSSNALLIMFIVDIICVAILVLMTAGAKTSPFCPIYFIIPALAIFLRESYSRLVFYTVTVSLLFFADLTFFLSGRYGDDYSTDEMTIAYGFVSIACLVLTTYVGFITRPI